MKWRRHLLLLLLCGILSISCVTTASQRGSLFKFRKGEELKIPQDRYMARFKNVSECKITLVLRYHGDKSKIRLHQTIEPGSVSVPVLLLKGATYIASWYCNCCQSGDKVAFQSSVNRPLVLPLAMDHNCTDFRWDKKKKRRWGA